MRFHHWLAIQDEPPDPGKRLQLAHS
jgi:hypothetical protein